MKILPLYCIDVEKKKIGLTPKFNVPRVSYILSLDGGINFLHRQNGHSRGDITDGRSMSWRGNQSRRKKRSLFRTAEGLGKKSR